MCAVRIRYGERVKIYFKKIRSFAFGLILAVPHASRDMLETTQLRDNHRMVKHDDEKEIGGGMGLKKNRTEIKKNTTPQPTKVLRLPINPRHDDAKDNRRLLKAKKKDEEHSELNVLDK